VISISVMRRLISGKLVLGQSSDRGRSLIVGHGDLKAWIGHGVTNFGRRGGHSIFRAG
jgi:hypothetical protein